MKPNYLVGSNTRRTYPSMPLFILPRIYKMILGLTSRSPPSPSAHTRRASEDLETSFPSLWRLKIGDWNQDGRCGTVELTIVGHVSQL